MARLHVKLFASKLFFDTMYKIFYHKELFMPNPLIILDSHVSVASKQFMTENIQLLKNMGYKKVLIEMNREVSPEAFKQQLKAALNAPSDHPLFKSSKELLRMIISLEQHNIPYEFIDPETPLEAGKIDKMIQDAAKTGDTSHAMAYRDERTIARDQIMAPETIRQTKLHEGGIIVLIGYQHTHFVRALELKQPKAYRFAIFLNNSIDAAALSRIHPTAKKEWVDMADETFRDQFYSAKVSYFDMGLKPSFEMIKAKCRLTNTISNETPLIGDYLNRATGQAFNYELDDDFVLTAKATMTTAPLEATLQCIKKEFPTLRFFTEKTEKQTVLTIPGVNLPENMDCLKNGFTKLGVMKS